MPYKTLIFISCLCKSQVSQNYTVKNVWASHRIEVIKSIDVSEELLSSLHDAICEMNKCSRENRSSACLT
jgi:hypothetical protein